MFQKDSILMGILTGFAIPFVAYAILLIINDFIYGLDFLTNARGESMKFSFSEKLLATIAICTNIIPFQYFRNRYMDYAMRGVMFPTLGYVFYWIYTHYDQLGF